MSKSSNSVGCDIVFLNLLIAESSIVFIEIFSIKMPKPQFNIEAFYIVMVISNTAKNFFTLEYVRKSDSAFFCEITEQGGHNNFSEHSASLSLDEFIQLIKNRQCYI